MIKPETQGATADAANGGIAPEQVSKVAKLLRRLPCFIGMHVWGEWEAGGVYCFPIGYRRFRRYHRHCETCGRGQIDHEALN